MAVYLRGMHGRCDLATVAFSSMYALCAYVLGYYWCLMWLDAVAILPLCILGLNRLIDRGSFKLYTISLAALMITNYYIGGMICIFIFFYFPILYFSRRRRPGARGCLQVTGKAVLCSFTGIFIAGVTLLPTFLSLQNTYYIDSEMPRETTFYQSLLDLFTNLLPNVEPTVREGLPNVYCGLLSVILFVFFLLSRRISLRKKLLNCALLGFLFLSLNCNKLDFMWHGFHFPNQLPYRYSFVVSFLLVILAYEAFLGVKRVSGGQIGAVCAAGTAYIFLAEKLYEGEMRPEFAYVCLLLLFAYCGFLAVYRLKKYPETLMCFILLVIVSTELMNQTAIGVETVSYTDRNEYFAESREVEELVRETRQRDDGFYRMEVANPLILNSPMLYHYPGVSEFSSTVNGSVSYLMDRIGLEAEDAKNRYNYVMTTPVLNAMLNVKYIISRGRPVTGESALELAGGKNLTALYENPYDLSVGYMVNSAVAEDWDIEQTNPFSVLEEFVRLATGSGETIFRRIDSPVLSGEGVSLGNYEDGKVNCASVGSGSQGTAKLTFTSRSSQQVYVYVETAGAESITARRENEELVQLTEDCGAIVSLGECEAGERIIIDIQYETGQDGYGRVGTGLRAAG